MSVIIRLQNLPWTASAMDIRNFFLGLNIPDGGVHIVGGDKGDAFIAFSTDEDARRAMLLDGGKVKDNYIKLFLSSKTEMQNVIADARRPSQLDLEPPRHADPYQGIGLSPMQNSGLPDMPRIPLFPAGMPVAAVGLLPSSPNMRGGLLDRPADIMPTHPDRFLDSRPVEDGMRRPGGPNGDLRPQAMQSRPFADGRPGMMNEGRDRDYGMADRQMERERYSRNHDRRSRSRSPRHRSRSSRTRDDSRDRSRGQSRDRKRSDRGSPRDRERDRSRLDSRRDRERHRDDRKDNGRSSPRRKSPIRQPFEGPTRCIHVECMPNTATYKDVRRFFRGHEIPRDGLRLKFEPEGGRRQRHCYVKFFKVESAVIASKMDAEIMDGNKVRITLISEDDFMSVVDDFSTQPDQNRPVPREHHGPEIVASPPLGSGSGSDGPGRGPPGPDRRGPPGPDRRGPPSSERRGPPGAEGRGPPGLEGRGPLPERRGPPGPEGRGPPPDRRGLPGHEGRGPPPERRGPPGHEGRGPPPDRRGPPGSDLRGPPLPERRGPPVTDERGPPGPDRRGSQNPDRRPPMGPDGRGPPPERQMDAPHGRPGMPPRDHDHEGLHRDFAPGLSRHIPPGGPQGPPMAQSDQAIGCCAVIHNLPPITRSELRDFFGEQKLVRGGLVAEMDSNGLSRGTAYINFLRDIDLNMAMKKSGLAFKGHRIEVVPISREEFDAHRNRIIAPADRSAPFRNGMERPGGPEQRRDGPPGGPPRRGLLPHPGRGHSPPPAQREYPGSEPQPYGLKAGPLCIRLYGINFNSTVETILDFLHGIPVKPEQVKILYGTSGEASGIAYVEFTNPRDHSRALERDKNFIGKRYINVTNISKEDAQREIEKFHTGNAPPRRGPPSKQAPPGMGGPQGRGLPPNTVFLSNLPFTVSPEEVLEFLQGFGPIPDSLRFREEGGKRTGEAMIVLNHPAAVEKALNELQGLAVRGRNINIST